MNVRFSLGSLFAAMALLGAYLATAIYALDLASQKVSMIATPIIALLALIAWKDPGLIGTIMGRAIYGCRKRITAILRKLR